MLFAEIIIYYIINCGIENIKDLINKEELDLFITAMIKLK